METKEMSYNELVINGFMALFFNLVMLPALFDFWTTTLVIYSCFVYAGIVVCADASGIFFSRT